MSTITSNLPFARQKLEEAIARRVGVGETLDHIMNDLPDDSIVRGKAFRFHATSDNGTRHPLAISAGEQNWTLHSNALRQMADKASVPTKYVEDLDAGKPWQRELLTDIMSRSFENLDGRYLLRSVRGEARGFLSDRFRRLDARPIFESFAEAVRAENGAPIKGHATELRVAVEVIQPRIFEINGDPVAFGLRWHTSDFGVGKHEIDAFILRLMCINGAVGEDFLSQVHLGGRLEEQIEFSRRTYELDTKTSVSAVRDVVHTFLSPNGVEKFAARIQAASDANVTPDGVRAKLVKLLTKDETRRVVESFESEDVTNLPAGNTVWRMSNAVSWLANNTKDKSRAMELEEVAGKVLAAK